MNFNVTHSPFIKAFLNIAGKKSSLELPKPTKISLEQLKTLRPVTDLDDRVIVYSPSGKIINTDPSQYEECLDRMSFENSDEIVKDFWRDKEMYNHSLDYKPYVYEKYSYDDIPVSDSTLNFPKPKIPRVYYPDTDLSYDDVSRLKLIDLTENIIPSSFDRKIHIDYDTIRDYAQKALQAWQNGVPENEIIKYVEKSVLKNSTVQIPVNNKSLLQVLNTNPEPIKIKQDKPCSDLFKFLLKHPNERNLVVYKLSDGEEWFDKTTAFYYSEFERKYFSTPEIAKQVLNECKSINDYPIPTPDKKLCEIAILLRKKSAQGLPTNNATLGNVPMRIGFSEYCQKTTAWSEKNSELIKRLKPEGITDQDYYMAAKTLLREDEKTVDFVLENLDETAKRFKDLRFIEESLNTLYPEKNPNTRKSFIINLLNNDFRNDRSLGVFTPDNDILIQSAKSMLDKNITISNIADTLDYLSELKNYFKNDPKVMSKILELCEINYPSGGKTVDKKLCSLLTTLCQQSGKIGAFEEQLMKKVNNGGQFNKEYFSALKNMLYNKFEPEFILKNLDEYVKYKARIDAVLAKADTLYNSKTSYIKKLMDDEFSKLLSQKEFEPDTNVILTEMEKMVSKEAPYSEILQKIYELQN